jgi:alkylhydroperoxidase family enzyme
LSTHINPAELPLDTETAAAMAKWMPPIRGIEPLALFRILIQHRSLSEALHPLAAFQLGKSCSLDPRTRELAISRTCARCQCEYEGGVHAGLQAGKIGLLPGTLAATVTKPPSDPLWSDSERCLTSLMDALHDTSTVSEELRIELRRHWNENQILELTVLTGFYHLISFVANVAGARLESWAPRFPPSPSGSLSDAVKSGVVAADGRRSGSDYPAIISGKHRVSNDSLIRGTYRPSANPS